MKNDTLYKYITVPESLRIKNAKKIIFLGSHWFWSKPQPFTRIQNRNPLCGLRDAILMKTVAFESEWLR